MMHPLKPLLLLCLVFSACRKEKAVEPVKTVAPTKHIYLSGDTYGKLIIEIAYQPGMQPEQSTLNATKAFLEDLIHKPSGIEFVLREIAVPVKAQYTFEELRQLEQQHRTQKTENNTAATYVFFTAGDYAGNSGNSKVLGLAYGLSSVVMFEKTIRDLSGGLAQPSTGSVESAVLKHEFGHLLGLVNNGTPMAQPHQDEARGSHCTNKECLMYYATETSDLIATLLNKSPQLDEACRQDLRAFGGK